MLCTCIYIDALIYYYAVDKAQRTCRDLLPHCKLDRGLSYLTTHLHCRGWVRKSRKTASLFARDAPEFLECHTQTRFQTLLSKFDDGTFKRVYTYRVVQ